MTRKIILSISLAMLLLIGVGGKVVKRGPGGGDQIKTVLWTILDADPQVDECARVESGNTMGTCDGESYNRMSPVYEPSASSVTIHKTSCWYEDGAMIANDSFTLCAAYQIADGTITNTSSCAVLVDGGGNDQLMASDVTPETISSTSFGLMLRVSAVTDVGSQVRAACLVEYSGGD